MRILPGLTASPAAATVKKGTYPVSTRILPTAGPVFTPLKAPTRTITNPILTGPFISTQERAAATKNILTSVTQKPAIGPLVLPKPYVTPKPIVQKPIQLPTSYVTTQQKAQAAAAAQQTLANQNKVGPLAYTFPKPTPKPVITTTTKAPPFWSNEAKTQRAAEAQRGLATGLDYFNRYTETALSTVGAIADTYAGYAWNKDTWNIAKERIKQNFSQIWSPPALEEAGVPAAIGRAAGNALSLAGTIITTYTLGKALVDFEQQLALNARRVAYYGQKAGQNPEEAVPGVSAGGPAPKIASERSYAFTPDEMRQGVTSAMSRYGMTRQEATDLVNMFQEIAKTPYDRASALTYQSNAKEPGFAVGSAAFSPPVAVTAPSVPTNLPAGQGDILGFVIQYPDIAVKTGVVASASAASQLATLTTQVMAGQAAVTNLQAAMTASIPNLGVLAHYADLTRQPINEVMAEQARLAVPVGQPVTTRQTVAPAPVRTAIAAQATAPVSRILPYATEAPPVSSPVATISTRQLPIAPPAAPITQPAVQTAVRPVPSATTEPWQMTPDERQSKIAALQVQYKRELAVPLMSEGSISPMQVGQMSKDQLARFQQDGQTRLAVEAQVQDLEHPELAKVRFDQNVVAKNQEQITALQSRLGVLQQFGQRKNGMMRPSYQKEIDKVQAQLDTLVAPVTAPPQISPSAAISNQETSIPTPVEVTAPQNAPATKEPWQESLQGLPEEIQSSILKEVQGVRIVKGREAEGGRFDQNTGIVYVDETEIKNPATLAHELMHAYVFHMENAPFIADFIQAKFPSDVAARYLAKNASGANYSEFSQEDVAVALTNYFFDPAKNKPEVNAVVEQYYGGVANTITNAAPLPAGQTTSGEVAQTVTNMVPDFATSGTGTTIPAEKSDIARITAVFDKAASAMWSGKLTPTSEGSYQKAFYDALVAAGVPKGALSWGKAITYYRETKSAHGLANRLAKVAAIVEKYNNKVLAEAMAKGREHAQMLDKQHAKLLEVRQADREKLAQSEQAAASRLRQQQTNDRIASEIEVGKQKHIDRAVAAALAEKEANLAKTAEWLHAEKALSARNKAEIASIVEYIENLDLRYMHAAEAKAIQEEAGAAGIELKHPFVAPGDTAFVWAMQNVGLHVVDSSVPLVEQQVLNLPELRALQAKVKAIADLSKEEKDVIKTQRQEALNKEIDDCVAELSEHITEKDVPNVRTGIYHGPEKKSNIANVLDKMREVPIFADIQFDRQQYLFQVIGGYRKRALYNSLYNKIYGADRATARSVNTDIALAHERLVQAGITPKTMSKERTLSNGIVVTQRDVIFAAVYAGNTNTLFKMMESNGWTEEDIRLSIESMSKEEVAWTNYMLDDMRMLYPQVSDAFAEINQGASLPDIMNYFPAIGEKGIDVALGQPGKAMVHPAEQMTLDSLAFYGWGQGDTLSGNKPSFVKHREGGKMVLQVDPISSYFSYKESALDYINRAPVVSSMRAIVADARFKDAFLIVAGEQRYKGLMEYVEAIANPSKALAPKNSVERAARVLRWNASAGTLSLRVSKAVTAFMSYGLGLGRYGPTAVLYGTHKLMGDFHGSMAEIKQYAPLLYQRLVDPVRWDALIADAERAWGGDTHIDAKKLSNLGFAVGDTLDVASSFLGYTWSLLRQHLNDPAWTLERASYVAERDLLQTHTSRLVQDRPAIYRGTELGQALVAFTGEATSQSMALMFDAKSAYHGTTPKAKFIAEWFTLTMGVALMGMLADAVARGRKKKTAKESGFWDGIWGRFILANIETFIPIAGRWITGSLRGFTGANDIITKKPIDEVIQLLSDIVKGSFGKATGHLLRSIGFVFGFPVLGGDELMRWLKPDNAASSSSTTIQKPSKPTKPSPTIQKPHK